MSATSTDDRRMQPPADPTPADAIFISWVRFHRRSEGIANALDIPSYYVHSTVGGVLRRYASQTRETIRIVRSTRPRTVILMQPPVIALVVVWLLTLCKRTRIVGDLHSGVFLDPKWRWAMGLTLLLLRGKKHAAIVTNEPLARVSRRRSVRTFVLHDLVTEIGADSEAPTAPEVVQSQGNAPLVLVPLAYANDEPVDAIIAAARELSHATWILTGKAPAKVRDGAPANVRFSGYVTNAEYDWLLRNSSVAVALTNREFTMQCVGYEAMSAAKPLVTSNTESLRQFFGPSAVYAEPSAEAILGAVSEALEREADLAELMTKQRSNQMVEQARALEKLIAWMSVA
ncbi:MAG: glycosyl transferase group 1 [Microbacterium sp.]|uniref:glycosyltransferase n=1 Tax=Microbacterium sp. TaxID=51671 RepID=UPI0026231D76|nr:glycosyltransferase [Microbacterium sp.]MDF2561860.1 glycosyl transferase group 1 [Microbacterium sp.]